MASKGQHTSPSTEFKSGKDNPNFGKHLSEEVKEKIRAANFGEKNPYWKGEKVAFCTLHQWIAKIKPKPDFCEECKSVPPRDIANVSGEYHRDINDFRWLCRSCHMKSDGRLQENLRRLNLYGKEKILKIAEINSNLGIRCPKCNGLYVVKRGFVDNRQRYGCKNCKIRFQIH